MIDVVLADDHDVVRQGLRALLETRAQIRVVGEAKDGLAAVTMVERLRPHVLVTDLTMPGLGGLDVTREVTHRCPDTKVVILSMHPMDKVVIQALRNGAMAYVLKDSGVEVLVEAIGHAVTGRRYLGGALSSQLIDSLLNLTSQTDVDPHAALTTREREVLHLAAEGLSNSQIGERLSISPRTAETHRGRVMRKLGLTSHTELVRHAFRTGLLQSDADPNN